MVMAGVGEFTQASCGGLNSELQEMTLNLCGERERVCCEFPPCGLVCCIDTKLVVLFWEILAPLGGGASLEEIDKWVLWICSLALLPAYHFCLLTRHRTA